MEQNVTITHLQQSHGLLPFVHWWLPGSFSQAWHILNIFRANRWCCLIMCYKQMDVTLFIPLLWARQEARTGSSFGACGVRLRAEYVAAIAPFNKQHIRAELILLVWFIAIFSYGWNPLSYILCSVSENQVVAILHLWVLQKDTVHTPSDTQI